eukprot:g23689.t1
MQLTDPSAIAGSYAGFTLPHDYSAVAQVRYELDLMDPELGLCPPGSSRNWTAPLRPCQKCSLGRSKDDGWDPDRFGDELCHACEPGSYGDEIGLAYCKQAMSGGQDLIEECEAFPDKTLTVAVLKDVSTEQTMTLWQPTFEVVLNRYFNRYGCYFKMLALDWQDLDAALQNGIVDVFFSDPGLIAEYRRKYNASAVASVLRVFNGFLYSSSAGVIFRHSQRNTDIVTLEDVARAGAVRNLSACPVHEESFDGWHAQWYEFFKAGLDVKEIFKSITFTNNHEQTAHLVATGACDVGFVSSTTLEHLASADIWEIESFAVINRKIHPGYIALASTDLYPQWELAVLPHVHRAIAEGLDVPLRSLQESDYASVIGEHSGFTAAGDETNVSLVRFQLGIEPLQSCGAGAYRDLAAHLNPCFPCPAGSASELGLGNCSLCPVGYVAPAAGSAACIQCPFGSLTSAAGSTSCVQWEVDMEMNRVVQIVVWVLMAGVTFFCVVMLYFVVAYRASTLMKASSAVFNVVIVTAATVFTPLIFTLYTILLTCRSAEYQNGGSYGVPMNQAYGTKSNRSHQSALSNMSGHSDVDESVLNYDIELMPSAALAGDEDYFYNAPLEFHLAHTDGDIQSPSVAAFPVNGDATIEPQQNADALLVVKGPSSKEPRGSVTKPTGAVEVGPRISRKGSKPYIADGEPRIGRKGSKANVMEGEPRVGRKGSKPNITEGEPRLATRGSGRKVEPIGVERGPQMVEKGSPSKSSDGVEIVDFPTSTRIPRSNSHDDPHVPKATKTGDPRLMMKEFPDWLRILMTTLMFPKQPRQGDPRLMMKEFPHWLRILMMTLMFPKQPRQGDPRLMMKEFPDCLRIPNPTRLRLAQQVFPTIQSRSSSTGSIGNASVTNSPFLGIRDVGNKMYNARNKSRSLSQEKQTSFTASPILYQKRLKGKMKFTPTDSPKAGLSVGPSPLLLSKTLDHSGGADQKAQQVATFLPLPKASKRFSFPNRVVPQTFQSETARSHPSLPPLSQQQGSEESIDTSDRIKMLQLAEGEGPGAEDILDDNDDITVV